MKLVKQALLVWCLGVVGCTGDDDGSGSSMVTVLSPYAPDAIIAYRDGFGPWTTKLASAMPISFAVSSARYSVAVACPAKHQVYAYELTLDELQTLDYRYECRARALTLSGVFAGNGTTGNSVAWGLDAFSGMTSANTPSYAFNVATGTHDLLATRRGSFFADRLLVMRDVEITDNRTLDLDFGGSAAIPLEVRTLQGSQTLVTSYVTAGGTPIILSVGNGAAAVVPSSAMAPGDLHVFAVGASASVGGPTSSGTWLAAREAPSIVVRPAAPNDQPAFTMSTAGTFVLPQVEWVAQPDAEMYRFAVTAGQNNWLVHVSSAVFDLSGTIVVPDLSGVTGWDATLGLAPGALAWIVSYYAGAPLAELIRPYPSLEGEIRIGAWQEEL